MQPLRSSLKVHFLLIGHLLEACWGAASLILVGGVLCLPYKDICNVRDQSDAGACCRGITVILVILRHHITDRIRESLVEYTIHYQLNMLMLRLKTLFTLVSFHNPQLNSEIPDVFDLQRTRPPWSAPMLVRRYHFCFSLGLLSCSSSSSSSSGPGGGHLENGNPCKDPKRQDYQQKQMKCSSTRAAIWFHDGGTSDITSNKTLKKLEQHKSPSHLFFLFFLPSRSRLRSRLRCCLLWEWRDSEDADLLSSSWCLTVKTLNRVFNL